MAFSKKRGTLQHSIGYANPRASGQLLQESQQLVPRRARRVVTGKVLEILRLKRNHRLSRLGEIPGKEFNREMIHVPQSFSRDSAVQQDHVAPILLRHVSVAGKKAVDPTIMAVG